MLDEGSLIASVCHEYNRLLGWIAKGTTFKNRRRIYNNGAFLAAAD
jgi:hypothetical protein